MMFQSPTDKPDSDSMFDSNDKQPSVDDLSQLLSSMKNAGELERTDLIPAPTPPSLPSIPKPASAPSLDFFTHLPENKKRKVDIGILWQIQLVSHVSGHLPLYLALYGDVLIGRSGEGLPPDIDLALYGGDVMGVSRQHAMLRPSTKMLHLIDLGSTNGTYHNQQRLEPNQSALLIDGDTIAFGQLRFTMLVIEAG